MNEHFVGLLAGSSSPKFHWWQGRSGEWWITTVFSLTIADLSLPSVYLFVKRRPDGTCEPLYVGQTSDPGRRMNEHSRDKLLWALFFGANELHLHLLASGKAERLAVETDIRNAHPALLNRQSIAFT